MQFGCQGKEQNKPMKNGFFIHNSTPHFYNESSLLTTYAPPLYFQIKQSLLSQINSGVLKPMDKIPSERELCSLFQVSRMTVRHALNELFMEGYVTKKRGMGTFVAYPKYRQQLCSLTSFSQDLAVQGKVVKSKVIYQKFASEEDSSNLPLIKSKETDNVIILERLRLANDEIFSLEKCLISFPNCEELLKVDFSQQSLYSVLINEYGIIPSRAHQEIEVAYANDQIASLLEIKPSFPVLLTRRKTFDQNNRFFEYTEANYRSDRYVFYAELVC